MLNRKKNLIGKKIKGKNIQIEQIDQNKKPEKTNVSGFSNLLTLLLWLRLARQRAHSGMGFQKCKVVIIELESEQRLIQLPRSVLLRMMRTTSIYK